MADTVYGMARPSVITSGYDSDVETTETDDNLKRIFEVVGLRPWKDADKVVVSRTDVSRKRKRRRRRYSRFERESTTLSDSDSSSDDSEEEFPKKLRLERLSGAKSVLDGQEIDSESSDNERTEFDGNNNSSKCIDLCAPSFDGLCLLNEVDIDITLDQSDVIWKSDESSASSCGSSCDSCCSSCSCSESESEYETEVAGAIRPDDRTCSDSCGCPTRSVSRQLPVIERKLDVCEPLYKKLLKCRLLSLNNRRQSACCEMECDRQWALNRIDERWLGIDYARSDLSICTFSWGAWKPKIS